MTNSKVFEFELSPLVNFAVRSGVGKEGRDKRGGEREKKRGGGECTVFMDRKKKRGGSEKR